MRVINSGVLLSAFYPTFGQNTGDRKVPDRHPLQRLFRLYQFSEETVLTWFLDNPDIHNAGLKKSRIEAIRRLTKTWLYLAQRETFVRGTRKCGYYDASMPHGGPAPGTKEAKDGTGPALTIESFKDNIAADWQLFLDGKGASGKEQTKYLKNPDTPTEIYKQIPSSVEIVPVRSELRKRRDVGPKWSPHEIQRREALEQKLEDEINSYKYQLDGDFTDDDIFAIPDEEQPTGPFGQIRLTRDNPCKMIKEVFVGFKRWSERYIGNCDGQFTHRHQVNRCLKFYNEFRDAAETAGMCDI